MLMPLNHLLHFGDGHRQIADRDRQEAHCQSGMHGGNAMGADHEVRLGQEAESTCLDVTLDSGLLHEPIRERDTVAGLNNDMARSHAALSGHFAGGQMTVAP